MLANARKAKPAASDYDSVVSIESYSRHRDVASIESGTPVLRCTNSELDS